MWRSIASPALEKVKYHEGGKNRRELGDASADDAQAAEDRTTRESRRAKDSMGKKEDKKDGRKEGRKVRGARKRALARNDDI